MMPKRLFVIVVALGAAACASPEASRQRGGGPGADIGNRPPVVKMHEGSRQYWETPVRIRESMPLGPSEQARQISLGAAAEGNGAGR